mmetsp:Transcript_68879/g.183478  ORF Transcript_68879/g.183478 Transcript_68879/m.183478 type:complete len:265 (+) Transcript_68879:790-1584(+)
MRQSSPPATIPLADVHFRVNQPLHDLLVPSCSRATQNTPAILPLAEVGLHLHQSLYRAQLSMISSNQQSRLTFKQLVHHAHVLGLRQYCPAREAQPVLRGGLQPLHCRQRGPSSHLLPHLLCPGQVQRVPHLGGVGSNCGIQRGHLVIVGEVEDTVNPLFLGQASHDLRGLSSDSAMQHGLTVAILGGHTALLDKQPVHEVCASGSRCLQQRRLLPKVLLRQQVRDIFCCTGQHLAGRETARGCCAKERGGSELVADRDVGFCC